MLTSSIFPPVTDDVLLREEKEASLRELTWLLCHLSTTLSSLREGLKECINLLAPTQPGSTLVLSSSRSESLKGYITRVGSRIVKGEMQVRMYHLPPTKGLSYYKLQLAGGEGMMLDQLTDVRNFVSSALRGVEGQDNEEGDEVGAREMMGRIDGVLEDIRAAKNAMSGTTAGHIFPYHALDSQLFDPPLPAGLSVDITISEAAIIAELRTLEAVAPVQSGNSITNAMPNLNLQALTNTGLNLTSGFRDRLFGMGIGGGGRKGEEDERIYVYKGVEVKVKERVRVESQDPSLMSVLAKLGSLEHGLVLARRNLVVCMEGCELL